ncbi:hypothetical protein AM336_03410 [Klebsiella aerogenes]|nr:hypothetical protein AM336_03410 [Klebsiella aerogenes]AUZ16851.1 hypothetical protein AL511_25505 [Klebsiella aerogenes]AXY27614.1 hypothetical protein CEQ05_04470 [Klebsiella aerogenes]PNE99126.1 hypothetical protein A6J70_18670 [Klebsiella aerogenes]RSW90289.1 hypothetical protein EGH42_20505 [Klebsiella aerogenes]
MAFFRLFLGQNQRGKINKLTITTFHETKVIKIKSLQINNLIFGTCWRWNWGGLDHAVQRLKQPRSAKSALIAFNAT